MNNKIFALALLTGSAFTSSVFAADGTINITGEIIDAGCNINGSGSSSAVVPVTLGKIAKTGFTNVGDTSGAKSFDISLTDCPEGISSATVRFSGPVAAGNNRVLAVTGGAEGVGVGLYESDSTTLIPLGSDSAAKTVNADSMNFRFFAKYIATAVPADISAGPANATADFAISYN